MRISFARIIRKLLRCFCLLSIFFTLFSGCATIKIDRHIVAVVDGEPITRKDLEYAIEIAHRREDLSKTKRLNIREFINRLIEDRLIIQEARRIGMEEDREIMEKVRAFKLRESVTMLYKEEILDRVSVTDDEIKRFFEENYSKQPKKDFEEVKDEIKQIIKNQKIDKLSRMYLKELRTKYKPWINRDLLSSIPLKMSTEERESYLNDQRIIVRVDKYTLTVGEFVKRMMPLMDEDSKQRIIDNWIDYRVVDLEALSRKYDQTTDLRERIKRYQDQLLKKAFYDRVIRPGVRISPQELRDYYETHKDDFLRPTSYKIQKIVVDSEPLARKILDDLKGGADFAYLARKYSKHVSSSRGGIIGWKPLSQMSAPVRAEVKRLSIGDFSGVIKDGSRYIIIKVLDVTEKRYKRFDDVREIIQRRLFREKFRERYNSFVKKLKTKAIITINEDEVKEIEELFNRVK